MERLNRSLPYFRQLVKSKRPKQSLKSMPDFVLDDIAEILYNVLHGKAKVKPKFVKFANSNHSKFARFRRIRKHQNRKMYLKKLKGGFISALIPLLASVIGAVL